MEFKNANPHDENVVAWKLNNINFCFLVFLFFFKIVKFEFRNKHHVLLFL
jgi:hypothetical protein